MSRPGVRLTPPRLLLLVQLVPTRRGEPYIVLAMIEDLRPDKGKEASRQLARSLRPYLLGNQNLATIRRS
jgi:hypothetical protein